MGINSVFKLSATAKPKRKERLFSMQITPQEKDHAVGINGFERVRSEWLLPKRGNLRGNRRVHALTVERESINTVAGIQRNKTNPPLSGEGGCRTVLVVGKYIQTRQRRLRGKMVKH